MKGKLCRLRKYMINETINYVIEKTRNGVRFPAEFELVEEEDGGDILLLDVTKRNGCYVFQYSENEDCALGLYYAQIQTANALSWI